MRTFKLAKFITAGSIALLTPMASHAAGPWVGIVQNGAAVTTVDPAVAAAVIVVTNVGPIVVKNIESAKNESGAISQVIKGTTGVSVDDIKEHGVLGGPNSFFRKPFG